MIYETSRVECQSNGHLQQDLSYRIIMHSSDMRARVGRSVHDCLHIWNFCHFSRTRSFQRYTSFSFNALVAQKPLVLLKGCFIRCSAGGIAAGRAGDEQKVQVL